MAREPKLYISEANLKRKRGISAPVAATLTKQLNVEIPLPLFEQLKTQADQLGTSIRGLVTLAIDQYVKAIAATIDGSELLGASALVAPSALDGARIAKLESDVARLQEESGYASRAIRALATVLAEEDFGARSTVPDFVVLRERLKKSTDT